MSYQSSFIVENLTRLVAGLLASGHYTSKGPWTGIEDSDDPKLLDYDLGKDWAQDGYSRRFQRHVMDDATSLLHDIIEAADQRAENERRMIRGDK